MRTMYEYELDDGEPPSEGLPMVIAALKDCSMREVTRLGLRIDPDALNRLVEDAADDAMRVQFLYDGYEVTVTDDEIRVDDGLSQFR